MAGNPTSSSSLPESLLPAQQGPTMIGPSNSQQLEPLLFSSPSFDHQRQQLVPSQPQLVQQHQPRMVQVQQGMVQPLQKQLNQKHGNDKVNGGIGFGGNNLIGGTDFQGMERNLLISRANQMQQSSSSSINSQLGIMRQQKQQPNSSIYGEMNFGGMNVTQQQPQQRDSNVSMNGPNPNNHQQQIGNQIPLQKMLQTWQQLQLQQQQQISQQSQIQQQLGHQDQLLQQLMGQTGQMPMLSDQAMELMLHGQFLRQQLAQQRARTGQGQKITKKSVNGQIRGLTQNGQQGKMQNAISQQQLKQMPATYSMDTSPLRLQRQQQLLSQQQLASMPLLQNPVGLNQQQLSQIVQHQKETCNPQVQHQIKQQQPLQQQLFLQHQSPRIMGPEGQISASLTGSQPDDTSPLRLQRQQQLLVQQQLASSQLHQNPVGLNQQQLSQIVQYQKQTCNQPVQHQIQQQKRPQQQLFLQQQSPRIMGPETGSQPDDTSPLRRQQQQQLLVQHQLASTQLHQNPVGLNQQQLSQIVQHQKLMCNPQVQHQIQQQQPPQQQLFHQQQSPRIMGPEGQKSVSLTVSQPDATASGATTQSESSSQGTARNGLLGKRKIQDLVSELGSNIKLDTETEEFMLEIADYFIDSVTTKVARNVAKHGKSSTLEAKDILLHLEKNYNLTIPGHSSEEKKQPPLHPPSEVQKPLELEVSETSNAAEAMLGQGPSYQVDPNHMMRSSSPCSEQLVSQSAFPHKHQQNPRF